MGGCPMMSPWSACNAAASVANALLWPQTVRFAAQPNINFTTEPAGSGLVCLPKCASPWRGHSQTPKPAYARLANFHVLSAHLPHSALAATFITISFRVHAWASVRLGIMQILSSACLAPSLVPPASPSGSASPANLTTFTRSLPGNAWRSARGGNSETWVRRFVKLANSLAQPARTGNIA